MDNRKAFMFALIAIFFSLMAIGISESISTTPGLNGSNGVAATTTTYYLHPLEVMNITSNISSPLQTLSITAVNGDTFVGNWTSTPIGVTIIPSGDHSLHYHTRKTSSGGNHIDQIFYECFLVDSSGIILVNHGSSERHILTTGLDNEGDIDLPMNNLTVNTTDRWKISVWINQTGSGNNPTIDFTFDDLTDAAFSIPSVIQHNMLYGIQGGKQNLSGDCDECYHLNQTEYNNMNLIPVIDNGTYNGDGTTNRFIPYNLNKIAREIDIVSNSTTAIGKIIPEGKIYSVTDGSSITVTPHDSTGFYVSGMYNINLSKINYTIGGTTLNTGGQENLIRVMPIIPSVSGDMINIGINIQTANGNVRMAVYNDAGSIPNTLLNETGSIPLVLGWNNASLITPITAGTQYWIGYNLDNTNAQVYYIPSGISRYKTWAYGTFQNPISGTSLSTVATINMMYNVSVFPVKYYWVAKG